MIARLWLIFREQKIPSENRTLVNPLRCSNDCGLTFFGNG
jgi:hypothetical protein